MTQSQQQCEYCGSAIPKGANFCEACGRSVKRSVPPSSSTDPKPSQHAQVLPPLSRPHPAAPGSPNIQPPVEPKRRSKLPYLLGGVGCFGILCVVFVIGAILILVPGSPKPAAVPVATLEETAEAVLLPQETEEPVAPTGLPLVTQPLATDVVPEPAVTSLPTETAEVIPPEPSADGWPPAIGQTLTDAYFSDDFSSDLFSWASIQDDVRFWGMENGHYVMHLLQPDYIIWAYLPIVFTPTAIGFDAAVQEGAERGAYGVLCYYQDNANYHFISIDTVYKEYSIGYIRNDEYVSLLDNMWKPLQALKESSYDINNIMILCDPGEISLFVNNQMESQVSVSGVSGGVSAIYGETWEDTPPSGFKVTFDNLYAYKPVQ